MSADWLAMKTEYITTATSYRMLAEKYDVSLMQIATIGKRENWVDLRKQHLNKTLAESLAASKEETVNRLARIQNATDRLLDKIEQAITELDLQLCKRVEKTKVIEYQNKERPDKPTKETIHEEETVSEVSSLIDRAGLKQIASALRDIKEIQMLKEVGEEDETFGVVVLPPRREEPENA